MGVDMHPCFKLKSLIKFVEYTVQALQVVRTQSSVIINTGSSNMTTTTQYCTTRITAEAMAR